MVKRTIILNQEKNVQCTFLFSLFFLNFFRNKGNNENLVSDLIYLVILYQWTGSIMTELLMNIAACLGKTFNKEKICSDFRAGAFLSLLFHCSYICSDLLTLYSI